MKIVIDNKTIRLIDRDVEVAKKTINHFLKTSKKEADEKGATSYYYTLLVCMHIMSTALIESLTPEVLELILNSAADHYDETQTT